MDLQQVGPWRRRWRRWWGRSACIFYRLGGVVSCEWLVGSSGRLAEGGDVSIFFENVVKAYLRWDLPEKSMFLLNYNSRYVKLSDQVSMVLLLVFALVWLICKLII